MGVDVETVAAQEADEGDAEALGGLDREVDGAETAQTIGIPATAAFWTISKLTRPETIRTRSWSGIAPARTCEPTSLSMALWRPTSSRSASNSPLGVNSPAACRPPVSSNARWAARSRSGSARMTERETTGPSGSGSARRATSSIEALPQIPHDAVATKWRSATFESSNVPRQADHDRVVGLAQRAGIAGTRAEHLLAIEQPLGPQEPDGELRLVARRAHGDRDRDRFLARSSGADLERRLADDAVVADLERLATDSHDPSAGHVANRWDRVAGQVGHDVPSRAATNVSNAVRAVSAASSATPSAGRPASPPPDADQSMNRSAAIP